jgi:hypothetical protein
MTFALASALTDWISWPMVIGCSLLFAIWRKDEVRAAIKLSKFHFSLEARDVRRKQETIKADVPGQR